MKIIYVNGDLMEAPETYILHGCNNRGVMGSGVAKAIRAKYPDAYKRYKDRYDRWGLPLGGVIVARCEDKVIFNGITQDGYGRDGKQYVDYQAIHFVMCTVNDYVEEGWCVAMPKIGAGLGGGDWYIINEIIEECSTRFQPVVYVKE